MDADEHVDDVEDQNEDEKLLSQAIELENEKENDEEELLKQAIALSLEM